MEYLEMLILIGFQKQQPLKVNMLSNLHSGVEQKLQTLSR